MKCETMEFFVMWASGRDVITGMKGKMEGMDREGKRNYEKGKEGKW